MCFAEKSRDIISNSFSRDVEKLCACYHTEFFHC